MNRGVVQSIARALIGVVIYAQLAIAAYACPLLEATMTTQAASASSDAGPLATAANRGCDDPIGASDVASPNLCAEHCKQGQQSDQVPGASVPVPAMHVLYTVMLLQPAGAGRAARLHAHAPVAASPPHAIVHCVFRI
jgi:hypothetical protein